MWNSNTCLCSRKIVGGTRLYRNDIILQEKFEDDREIEAFVNFGSSSTHTGLQEQGIKVSIGEEKILESFFKFRQKCINIV